MFEIRATPSKVCARTLNSEQLASVRAECDKGGTLITTASRVDFELSRRHEVEERDKQRRVHFGQRNRSIRLPQFGLQMRRHEAAILSIGSRSPLGTVWVRANTENPRFPECAQRGPIHSKLTLYAIRRSYENLRADAGARKM